MEEKPGSPQQRADEHSRPVAGDIPGGSEHRLRDDRGGAVPYNRRGSVLVAGDRPDLHVRARDRPRKSADRAGGDERGTPAFHGWRPELGAALDSGSRSGNSPNWIAIDPVDPQIMYAMYQGFGGGHVSVDGGLHWSPMTPGFEGFTIDADRNRPGFVYGVGGWTSPQRSGHYGSRPGAR